MKNDPTKTDILTPCPNCGEENDIEIRYGTDTEYKPCIYAIQCRKCGFAARAHITLAGSVVWADKVWQTQLR